MDTSPRNSTTSSSSSGTNSPTHGHRHPQAHNNNLTLAPPPPPPPPPPPKTITRSEPANPYPTTFVQADTNNFKNVVQMLTGSSETAKNASSKPASSAQHQHDPSSRNHNIPPIKSIPKKQQGGFKLYERRNSLKNFKISPLNPFFNPNNPGFSPRKSEILSPSILDFPALVLSPVTPLIPDPFDRSGFVKLDPEAEEKAIKEKGFFLHQSPTTTPRGSEPRLLPLFPETSPRISEKLRWGIDDKPVMLDG